VNLGGEGPEKKNQNEKEEVGCGNIRSGGVLTGRKGCPQGMVVSKKVGWRTVHRDNKEKVKNQDKRTQGQKQVGGKVKHKGKKENEKTRRQQDEGG